MFEIKLDGFRSLAYVEPDIVRVVSRNGNTLVVVADSVNPRQITRESWSLVARNAGVPLVEVEVLCSDPVEHRRRIESKKPDLDGLPALTWASVCHRTYEEWSAPHLVIDTAGKSVAETEQELIDRLSAAGHL